MSIKKNNIPSDKKISVAENDADNSKKESLLIASKELKEQLETILNTTEVLLAKKKNKDEKISEYLFKIKNAAEKMDNLLNEICPVNMNPGNKNPRINNVPVPKTIPEVTELKKNIDEHLFITEGNKPQFVKIHDIECITAFNEYTNVYLNNSKKVIIRKSLREWEGVLPDTMFIRIHRSTIINFEYVDRVEKFYSRSYVVYLKSINQPFVISQRYLAKLKKKLFF
jgi:DNA-binding LytR/AlgR family response regulator